jgi:hypothetical protein
MNNHIKAEIALGIALLVCVAFISWDQYHKALDNAVAQAKAQVLKDAQADKDAALKASQQKYETDTATLQDALKAAQKTNASMAAYVQQHVTLPQPLQVNTGQPYTVTLQTGDAVIPAIDADPLWQNYAAGEQCKLDIRKCQSDLVTWQQKYDLKTQESAQWEKAAKGGSWLKRFGQNAFKIGIGVGIGYAIHH